MGRPVKKNAPLADRLDAGFVKQANGCWLWTGALNADGYGVIGHNGGKVLTHRAMYERFKGPLKENALHSCDNRACGNPDHLWDGTQEENVQDAIAKGRMLVRAKNGSTKLDETRLAQVQAAKGTGSTRALARQFGVAPSTIRRAFALIQP